MARNFETDYLHVFRFGIVFDGQLPLGFCKAEIQPRDTLTDDGWIEMESAWTPLIIDFLRQAKRSTLDVHAFRMASSNVDDPADLTFRLHDVIPALARMHPIKWDATSSDILKVGFCLEYSKLELIEGEIKLFEPPVQSLCHKLEFNEPARAVIEETLPSQMPVRCIREDHRVYM